jgi:deoxyribose-phosphate aldolase
MTINLKQLLDKAKTYQTQLPDLPLIQPVANAQVASYVDHTLLKPEATPEQVEKLCLEAREFGFAAVCINPIFVPQAARLLEGSSTKVCTVVGFPLGATLTRIKVAETHIVIDEGAQEVDMVIPVGMLKAGYYQETYEDVLQVTEACHQRNVLLKVILETCLLEKDEKIIACLLCKEAGADFVKTSTGFNKAGATPEDVELMRRVVGAEMGVKAAGGVRSLADAQMMLKVGANRLGTSAGLTIVKEAQG